MKQDVKKQPIANDNFYIGNKLYKKGKEIDITDMPTLVRLNEKGYIGPFSIKELKEIGKEKSNG